MGRKKSRLFLLFSLDTVIFETNVVKRARTKGEFVRQWKDGNGTRRDCKMESANAAFEKRYFFSLIELMLVTSVILILGTLSVSSVVNSRRQARQAYCSNNLRQLALAFQMYQQDYKHFPVQERFLDDFRPVYTYIKSLNAFTCPGNPSTVSKISKESSLVGGTDYVFWTGQLATDLPVTSSTDSGSDSGDSDGCNCNSNVCTCGKGNGNGNNGGNGNGNNKNGSGNSNGKGNGNGSGNCGNGNGNNGNNGNGNGNGNGNTGSSGSGSSTTTSGFFAYGADVSDSKFQRTLADKLTRPVIYDKCGPAHGNYINLCDLRDASVSSRRDMCDLWVLNSSKELIVDSTDPFPK